MLTGPLSNRGEMTVAERNADRAVSEGRAAVADFLNADPRGVIFGRSMTALTFELARTMAKDWRPGDEVVVSRLDHDAQRAALGDRRRGRRGPGALGRPSIRPPASWTRRPSPHS